MRRPLASDEIDADGQVREAHGLCKERRECKSSLEAATGRVPLASALESLNSLEAAIARGEELGVRGAATGGSSYYHAALGAAKSEFHHLTKEVELWKKCAEAAGKSRFKGDVNHLHPGEVDAEAFVKGETQFASALSALEAHQPHSLDGQDSAHGLRLLFDLRTKALAALALGEGAPADEQEWRAVETQLREVKGFSPALPASAYVMEAEEVELISHDLALRAAVDDVVNKLNEAKQAVSDELLGVALDQARVLHMYDHPDDSIRAVVMDCDELLPKVVDVRRRLAEALREVKEDLLREALCAQSAIGFGVEVGMLGYEVVVRARQLYAWVVELTSEAALAAQGGSFSSLSSLSRLQPRLLRGRLTL